MDRILALLEENAKLSYAQIAAMLDMTEEEVAHAVSEAEKTGVIKGYQAVVDWEKAGRDPIIAFIEVKVTPQPDFGFEQIAGRIMQFDEVSAVYLMSGGFDLTVIVEGTTFKEVAMFVSHRLAPLENVLSTATHFVLRKYKDRRVILGGEQADERGRISLC